MEQAFQKVIFQQPRLSNWCKNHGSETSFCPFAHFYMPDLIKQNLCFAMVSAFKGDSRLFVSLVFYSAKELFKRNLNFAKT
jgi:hypothetical protein